MQKFKFALLAVTCAYVSQARQLPVNAASPVDLRIAAARKQVQENPTSASFNNLAFSLIRKGRDFRDEALYEEAGKALDQSLRLSAGNFDAQKLRVAVLLGLNEPGEALKLGAELNHKVPDDIAGWGLLVDANVALGNYDQAEKAAQWILDLRPGSSLGFEKAAGLRELFGDGEGSLEFLDEANRRTSQNDLDQRSWLLTQKARLVLASGDASAAGKLLDEALRLFPDSQLAAAVLAQVRLAEGNDQAALTLLEGRYRRVPNAANLYDWAEALAISGQSQAASLEFGMFEKQARADVAKHQTAILQLISYYSDRKTDIAQAVSLASTQAAERHDAPTLAAYAWALYLSGKFSEAKSQMDKALAVGIRNPVYFCHAEAISNMVKDSASAERYSRELAAMPRSSCSVAAPLETAHQVRP